jgi:hypothetical protein
MCTHCLGHLSPLPLSPTPLLPGRTYSALFSNFVEEKTWDNKKCITFLLVWDKDSYTERFLALLPCTCVLQPELVHLYQTYSLLPSHLPMGTSVSLRLLYSLLYSGHVKHFQGLGFLLFPIPHVCVLSSVCELKFLFCLPRICSKIPICG